MRRIALLALFVGFLIPLFASAPAHAQATRTWVSGVGDDANPCSRTAPCKTFAGAISKTATAGEINCLDPGGFGAITITKAITLNCSATLGSILVAGTAGVIVNAGATDRVVLKSIQIQGILGSATAGTVGVNILNAGQVVIEDCTITQFNNQAIADVRGGTGNLYVTNSNLRLNGGAGIGAAPTGTVNIIIESSRLEGNAIGVAAGPNSNFMIKRSVVSGNTTNGIEGDGGTVSVNSSSITGNATGVSASGTIRLSDNDIAYNGTGITGTATSFGQNRIYGNTSAGTAPSAAGGSTSFLGTQ